MQVSNTLQGLWHVHRVKRLIRAHGGVGTQCLVSVRETYCDDPSCEGPATDVRIVWLDLRELKTMIHKAPPDITAQDVAGLLANI